MKHNRVLVWFSCGVTSAVAGKLTLKEFPDAEVLYCDTGGEHPDNARFLKDVAKWYERDITVLKNPKYKDHFDVFEKQSFIVGPHGAVCTRKLKRELRVQYQRPDDLHIFGFDAEESDRVADFHERNPELNFRAPLIEQRLTKANCKYVVEQAGIELPEMYKLGFRNNNCIGCVKGGAGYWNKIRVLFPEHFNRMAAIERKVGHTILRNRKTGEPIPLDVLPTDYGRDEKSDPPDCDPFFCASTVERTGLCET